MHCRYRHGSIKEYPNVESAEVRGRGRVNQIDLPQTVSEIERNDHLEGMVGIKRCGGGIESERGY